MAPCRRLRVGLDVGQRRHLAGRVVHRRDRVDVPARAAPARRRTRGPARRPRPPPRRRGRAACRWSRSAPRRTRSGTGRGCGRPTSPASTRPPPRAACARRDAMRPAGIVASARTRRASTRPGVAPTRPANAAPAESWIAQLVRTDRSRAAARPAACRSSAVPIPRPRAAGCTNRTNPARSRFSLSGSRRWNHPSTPPAVSPRATHTSVGSTGCSSQARNRRADSGGPDGSSAASTAAETSKHASIHGRIRAVPLDNAHAPSKPRRPWAARLILTAIARTGRPRSVCPTPTALEQPTRSHASFRLLCSCSICRTSCSSLAAAAGACKGWLPRRGS